METTCPICQEKATSISTRRRNNWFFFEGKDCGGTEYLKSCEDCYWKDYFILESRNFGDTYFQKVNWDYMSIGGDHV